MADEKEALLERLVAFVREYQSEDAIRLDAIEDHGLIRRSYVDDAGIWLLPDGALIKVTAHPTSRVIQELNPAASYPWVVSLFRQVVRKYTELKKEPLSLTAVAQALEEATLAKIPEMLRREWRLETKLSVTALRETLIVEKAMLADTREQLRKFGPSVTLNETDIAHWKGSISSLRTEITRMRSKLATLRNIDA